VQPLEVTEEIFQTDEPLPVETPQEEFGPIPIMIEEGVPAEFELCAPGAYEVIEPQESTEEIESASWASGEALVLEDHHDDAALLGGLSQAAPAAALPVKEGSVSMADQERAISGFGTPIVPFLPMMPVNEGQPQVRTISATPAAVREIYLPIRLEIGGQAISFDLRISLNLAALSTRSRESGTEEGGAL
jgi:hypothetical protein